MRHDVGSLPAVRVNVSPTRSTVCYRSVTTSDSSNSSPGGDRAAIHPGYDPPISAANSGGHCNASASLSDGVIQSRVCRGRVFSE